jgi:hypothetical protein
MHGQSNRLKISDCIQYLILLGLILFVLIPVTPTNMPVASRDSGVFLYSGWRLINGDIPYVDFWDHKPPLIFFINALGLLISGSSRWGIWVIEFISLSLAAILGFKLIKKAFDSFTAIYLSFIWLFTLTFMLEGGNYTTEYTLPIQFGCIWLFLISENKSSYKWRGVAIGALSALAFFFKQNTIGILIAIVTYVLLSGFLSHRSRRILPTLATILAGFIFIAGSLITLFAAWGALDEFWNSAFQFNFIYTSGPSLVERMTATYRGWLLLSKTNLAWFAVFGWAFCLFTFIFKRNGVKTKLLPLLALGVIGLPVEVILAGLGGRLINHHFMTMLPVFILPAAFMIHILFKGLTDWLGQISKSVLNLILILTLVISTPLIHLKTFKDYFDMINQYTRDDSGSLPVVAYILENTIPEDTVLVLEAESYINFATSRPSPTRYVYQYPLMTAGYTTDAMVADYLSDLIMNPPQLVVDKSGKWISADNFAVKSDEIDLLIQEIRQHYSLEAQIGGWMLYRYSER